MIGGVPIEARLDEWRNQQQGKEEEEVGEFGERLLWKVRQKSKM